VNWISVILFGGASYQLWFIPALLIWAALLAPLMLFIAKAEKKYTFIIFLVIAYVLFAYAHIIRAKLNVDIEFEMLKYMVGLAGYAFVAIALWEIFNCLKLFERPNLQKLLFFISLFGIAYLLFFLQKNTSIMKVWFIPLYSTGILILSFSYFGPVRPIIIKKIATCTYGIFLTHAIFVEGLQNLALLLNVNINTFIMTVGLIITSFAFSAAMCIYFSQKKATRWLVT
jgi:peptidoglycan/LPS O-acetylase OafA/YrhL